MKKVQGLLVLMGLVLITGCSKSALSTGSPGGTSSRDVVPASRPNETSKASTPLAPTADPATFQVCSADMLQDYAKVTKACAGVQDPFNDPTCYNADDQFDSKYPNLECKSADGKTVICRMADGSCSALNNAASTAN